MLFKINLVKTVWCMHIRRGQLNLYTGFRTHIEEMYVLEERKMKTILDSAIIGHVHAFHCKNPMIPEHSDPPCLSLSSELPSTNPTMLQTISCEIHAYQNSPVSKKSLFPSLQPHHKKHKCIKLMF